MQHSTLKSLTKGLNILKLFSNGKGELSLTEISRLLELNKPTAFRLIATLIEQGFLVQREKKGKYFLGPIFYDFNRTINSRIYFRNIAAPYLMQLSQRVNEVANLVIDSGVGDIYLENFYNCSRPNSVSNIMPNANVPLPLYSTCLGKIILANMPEEKLKRYLNNVKLEPNTPNTITDIEVLKTHLKVVRQEGAAFDDEEFYMGVRSVAVGITDHEKKVVGAIGVIAPSIRLTYFRMQELVKEIKSYAEEISLDISNITVGQMNSEEPTGKDIIPQE